MTTIKMLQTRKGSEDGFTVKQFCAGQVYHVRENLARTFFAAGYAVKCGKKFKKRGLKKKRFK